MVEHTAKISWTLEGLDSCPQCGVATPLLTFRNIFFDRPTGTSNTKGWASYQCSSCEDLVAAMGLFATVYVSHPFPQTFSNINIDAIKIIPEPDTIDGDLPPKPRRYLEQAIRSLHAPDGAIMLAGSAIDAMLKLKNYTEGSVYDRIEKAVQANILTTEMSKWAHAVRLESNKPRHADINEPHGTPELAKQTVEFAKALGEYLFSLPARIARGTEQAEQSIISE